MFSGGKGHIGSLITDLDFTLESQYSRTAFELTANSDDFVTV